MAKSIVTDNLRFNILKAFEERLKSEDQSLYMYYSRPLKWSAQRNDFDLVDDEETPNDAQPNQEEEHSVKSALLAMKLLNNRDIAVGFKAIFWESGGAPYVEYSDRTNLAGSRFYAINSENRVYKCIDNNGGATPTDEPTGSDPSSLIATSDGYLWKYMFSVSDSLLSKFNVQGYYPTSRDEQVENAAVPGSIEKIVVDDPGSGFFPNSLVPVYVFGDGDQNTSAKLDIQNVSETGEIRTVLVTNPGSNYDIVLNAEDTRPLPVLISQTSVDGNLSETILSFGHAEVNAEGQIVDVNIIIPGSGYSLGEATIIQSSCVAYAQVNSEGGIERVNVEYPGKNFTLGTAFLVSGSSQNAVVTPIIPPAGGHGSNPQKELYSSALLFNTRIAYEEEGSDFTVENDFRTVGIIENPRETLSGDIATSLTLSGKTIININESNANGFSNDEVIIGLNSGARATLIDSPNESTLRVIRDDIQSNTIPFQINEPILGSETSENSSISSITPPEYVPYSGDLLFINNREPITRNKNQIETVNFILHF
jgi:hypothetical protein